jgi:hypothetical protein
MLQIDNVAMNCSASSRMAVQYSMPCALITNHEPGVNSAYASDTRYINIPKAHWGLGAYIRRIVALGVQTRTP